MQVSHRWRTATLLAGALVAGTIVGPPLVQAATTAAGLVRIEGGGSSHVASVSSTGQLQVAEASPSSVVTVFSYAACGAGGMYTIPTGKALIISAVDFYNWNSSTGPHWLVLYAGAAANPCGGHIVASAIGTDNGNSSQNQVFPSGIAIPAGDAIGLNANNDAGSANLYGYLVPASAVPASGTNLIGSGRGPIGRISG
jgi:hypothetical protein